MFDYSDIRLFVVRYLVFNFGIWIFVVFCVLFDLQCPLMH